MPNNEPTESSIQLTGRYFLNRDRFNMWITEEYDTTSKSGKPTKAYRNMTGYHDCFKTMLRSFIEAKARTAEAKNVKELLEKLTEIQEDTKAVTEALLEQAFQNRFKDI